MAAQHGFDHPLRLLVATDLTVRADLAFERAVLIARATGAHLEILNIVGDMPSELREDLMAKTRNMLTKQVASAKALGAFAAEIAVEAGSVDGRIVERARGGGFDLVIAGHHREQIAGDRWLGSTISRVLRQGDRPVLIVKRAAHRAYERILVAVDLSETSGRAIEFALRLFPGTEIILSHAFEVPYGGFLPRQLAGQVSEATKGEEREHLTTWLDRFGALIAESRCRIVPVVERGRAEPIVMRHVEERKPELVVLGTHGRTGIRHAILGSVAEHIIAETPTDVLAVR